MLKFSVFSISSITLVSTLIDATVADPNAIGQVGRLGLDGVLAVAVIILWKKLQEMWVKLEAKDVLIMSNYKSMADALAANNTVVCKMSDILEEMHKAVEVLTSVRAVVPAKDKTSV